MSRIILVIFLFGSLAAEIACAPVSSRVWISRAELALREAKTAGAEEFARHAYKGASLYLSKAKEEETYSDFWGAEKFARQAAKMALDARKEAELEAKHSNLLGLDKTPPPVEEVPVFSASPEKESVFPILETPQPTPAAFPGLNKEKGELDSAEVVPKAGGSGT